MPLILCNGKINYLIEVQLLDNDIEQKASIFARHCYTYLEFLLVNGKVSGLDVEKTTPAETQHVFMFCVP